MNKKKIRTISIITILIFSLSATSIFASTTYSAWKKTGKIYNKTYKYRAGLISSSSSVQARGHAEEASGSRVSAGYIGARASLYKSNGKLYKSGSWDYNDSSCVGVDVPGASATANGTYYCVSKFKFYNGNGYSSTYKSNQSPNIKLSKASMEIADLDVTIRINSNGQTYGTALVEMYGEECPDLISAVGENGVEGYILATDLDRNLCSTLEEALEVSLPAGEKEIEYIPLYDKNGVEIGTFKLETIGATEIN